VFPLTLPHPTQQSPRSCPSRDLGRFSAGDSFPVLSGLRCLIFHHGTAAQLPGWHGGPRPGQAELSAAAERGSGRSIWFEQRGEGAVRQLGSRLPRCVSWL